MATLSFEGTRELRWIEVGSCLVVFMEAEVEFADQEWDDWMEAMERPTVESLVVASWGPIQPSHQQWRRATRMMRDNKLPVAVVSEARHNFALAKAASWLGTNVESFRWSELDQALESIGFVDNAKLIARSRTVALRDCFGPRVASAEYGQQRAAAPVEPRSESKDGFGYEASSAIVFENNEEIQAKLAEIQARLAARNQN